MSQVRLLWVALERKASPAEVRAALVEWFPCAPCSHVEVAADGTCRGDWDADIPFELFENASEFPCHVEFVRFPCDESLHIRLGVELARRFAARFACRAICEGSGLGDDDSPYWDVVWDRGVSCLADDSGSAFGDGSGGPVRVLRPIQVPPLGLKDDGSPEPDDSPA